MQFLKNLVQPVGPELLFVICGPCGVVLISGKTGLLQQNVHQLEVHRSVDL